MLSEISQIRKDKYHMESKIQVKLIETEKSGFQRLRRWGNGETLVK